MKEIFWDKTRIRFLKNGVMFLALYLVLKTCFKIVPTLMTAITTLIDFIKDNITDPSVKIISILLTIYVTISLISVLINFIMKVWDRLDIWEKRSKR